MLHLTLSPTDRPHAASPASRIVELALGWWHRRRLQRRLKATARILHALDDRTLKDIGLHRSEIESVVGARGGDRRPQRIDLGMVITRG
jgi:uncharacterized protein YjiS (DUF1127 family)